MNQPTRTRNFLIRGTSAVLGSLLLLLLTAPSAALADHRDHRRWRSDHHDRHRGQYDRHHDYRHDDHRYSRHGHHTFSLPRYIHQRHYRTYKPYYHGRVYYAPHRHHHRIYHFPVWIGASYSYRPYAYCDGEIFYGGSGHHHHGGWSFRLRF